MQKKLILAAVVLTIIGVIFYLEGEKAGTGGTTRSGEIFGISGDLRKRNLPEAKEIVAPAGFINAEPFTIAELIGKKVILVDFWTYSCINCQRTFPYLTAWHEKYADSGLAIVGIHTPEFEFEKKYDNVLAATEKFGIEYPVVLDNDYGTWRAYGNRYWPRKYLIDIDGRIIYDHIGEGGYEETERKIQELLTERMIRLGEKGEIASDVARPSDAEAADPTMRRTPEIYFGAFRNESFGNGTSRKIGPFTYDGSEEPKLDRFFLVGEWEIESEYARNTVSGAKILLRYRGQKVFFVAGAEESVTIRVTRDGKELGTNRGRDVDADGNIVIREEGLYRLVEDDTYGEHLLEIEIQGERLEAFTFTFG